MNIALIKRMMDACYQAKRVRDLLPALPDGVLPSFIQYLDAIQTYRDKMKKFKGEKCTERHEYHDVVRPGKKRVLIVKQVAGQGAMYDTHLFSKEPSGVEGGRSIIDMGNMPILVTPNEYRDGIIRSMQ